MSATQALSIFIHGRGVPEEQHVEWALDGATLRTLLDDLLTRLGLKPLAASTEVQIEAALVGSLDVSLREALDEACVLPDPKREIAVALVFAPTPALAPSPVFAPASAQRPAYPSAPPPSMARPPAPAPSMARPSAPAPVSVHYPHDEDPPIVPPVASGERAPRPGESRLNSVRRATVEYFSRMTPQKVFPLKVTLAPWSMDRKLGPDVARVVSEEFTVDPAKWIEIEPVLPGCTVYPSKQSVPGGTVLSEVRFSVVAQVKGEVPATVYLRNGEQQRLVRFKVTVAEPRRAAWTAAAGLLLPYATTVMKHEHLDFESQLGAGFPLYLRALRWVVHTVGPTELATALLLGAAALWLTTRPRRATAEEDLDAPLYAT